MLFEDKHSGRWLSIFDIKFPNAIAEGSDEKHWPSCRAAMVENVCLP